MQINFTDPHEGWDMEIDTETKKVYFKRQDYEASINRDGEFTDWFGSRFRVILPFRPGTDPIIECLRWTRLPQSGVRVVMHVVLYWHPDMLDQSPEVYGPFKNEQHQEEWVSAKQAEGWNGKFHQCDMSQP